MLRQSLEIEAAINLAETGTQGQIDQLYALFEPFLNQEAIDAKAYFNADRQFHSLMIEWCDNSLLRHINESLRLMDRSFSFGLLRPPKETIGEHMLIVDALRGGDVTRVQEVVRQHTETTKQALQNIGRQMRALGIDASKLSINDIMHVQTPEQTTRA